MVQLPVLNLKERDNETGLDYFLARYYSSAQGRFTSYDPLFINLKRLIDPQRLNLYAYSRNKPLKYTDKNGVVDYDMCVAKDMLLTVQVTRVALKDPKDPDTQGSAKEQL